MDHPRNRFDNWYSQQVMQQLYEKSGEELENLELPAIDLSMTRMKEISAEWIVNCGYVRLHKPEPYIFC